MNAVKETWSKAHLSISISCGQMVWKGFQAIQEVQEDLALRIAQLATTIYRDSRKLELSQYKFLVRVETSDIGQYCSSDSNDFFLSSLY